MELEICMFSPTIYTYHRVEDLIINEMNNYLYKKQIFTIND